MTAYMIFDAREVTDEEGFAEYKARVFPITEKFGGTYRVIGGQPDIIEGDWGANYIVVIEFPTREQANAWYTSEEYAEVKALRLRSVAGNGALVAGLDEDAEFGRDAA